MFLVGALLTLCWSLAASAGAQDAPQVDEAPSFLSFTNLSLDLAFEEFATRAPNASLRGLAGPSTMNCQTTSLRDGIETCVVTARRSSTSVPSALATR
jgi:hypothetical protein